VAKTRIPINRTVGRSVQTIDSIPAQSTTLTTEQLNQVIAALAAREKQTNPTGASPTYWSLIQEIPQNIVDIAALTSHGFLTRNQDGTWTLVPPPPVISGEQGPPGEDGVPGIPGRDGATGPWGRPAPQGIRDHRERTGHRGCRGRPGQTARTVQLDPRGHRARPAMRGHPAQMVCLDLWPNGAAGSCRRGRPGHLPDLFR
jgi:hypothetical protein